MKKSSALMCAGSVAMSLILSIAYVSGPPPNANVRQLQENNFTLLYDETPPGIIPNTLQRCSTTQEQTI